jgi:hypothetical protein
MNEPEGKKTTIRRYLARASQRRTSHLGWAPLLILKDCKVGSIKWPQFNAMEPSTLLSFNDSL